jgi:hypothetical protein
MTTLEVQIKEQFDEQGSLEAWQAILPDGKDIIYPKALFVDATINEQRALVLKLVTNKIKAKMLEGQQ